jgi:orotate phosphoribosyltransferase
MLYSQDNKIANLLVDSGCYITAAQNGGDIVFPSGERTKAYLSCRLLMSRPTEREKIEDALVDMTKSNFDVEENGGKISVVGLATAGIVWAHAVARGLRQPMLYVRSEQKQHGVGGLIEGGHADSPKSAVIVDDAIGTGATINRAIKELGAQGIKTLGVACIALMGSEIEDYLLHRGISVNSLTDYDQILSAAEDKHLLNDDEAVFMGSLYRNQGVVDE